MDTVVIMWGIRYRTGNGSEDPKAFSLICHACLPLGPRSVVLAVIIVQVKHNFLEQSSIEAAMAQNGILLGIRHRTSQEY